MAEHNYEALGREKNLKRRRVSLCRHKLQGRAYPKIREIKAIRGPPEQLPEQKHTDLDHEWLQLIQMEKTIEKQKNKLLETRANDHWDPDEGRETVWQNEGSSATKQADQWGDEDLEYLNAILNSFSGQNCNHKNSKKLQLESFTPEDALTRALPQMKMPQEFNLKFNQNLTSRVPEEDNFSYFSNIEEEGPIELGDYFSDDEEDTELGDYFSDDKEDDSWEEEERSSESDPWSHIDFDDSEDNFSGSPSESNKTIFGLRPISETNFEDQGENRPFSSISSISEETRLAFSAWQPFIPPEHAFRNSAALSWPSDFSLQSFSSQEPTLIQISTITTTKLTPVPTQQTPTQPETTLSPRRHWHSFKPVTENFTRTWTKPWPGSTRTYKKAKNLDKDFQDRPEPSKRCKLWKQPSLDSNKTSQNQNTRCQNTPRVTNAGREPQASIQSQSQTYSNTTSERSTTRPRSWGTKWHKFSIRIPTYQTKLQKSTKRHQKSSRKTPLWLWSRRRYPHTCSLGTAKTGKPTQKQKISPRGENHFSKRRSESESYNQ
jgi:hypothetical protein